MRRMLGVSLMVRPKILHLVLLIACCSPGRLGTQVSFAFSLDTSSTSTSTRAPTAAPETAVPSSLPGPERIHQIHQQVKQEHEEEFLQGRQVFGSSLGEENDDEQAASSKTTTLTFTDEDFHAHWIGEYHGPTIIATGEAAAAKSHPNNQYVFETKQPVLTDQDCDYLIASARSTIRAYKEYDAQQQSQREEDGTLTNSDLDEVRLSQLPPATLVHLRRLLQERLYPLLKSRYGDDEEWTLYDGLVLGNMAPCPSQPIHRDASYLTLNIPLSSPDDFVGGGTYIEPLEEGFAAPMTVARGQALCHLSGVRHAGTGIPQGERWVLVMFLLSKTNAQIARRCHSHGLQALADQDFEAAHHYFQAGLQDDRKDFLLHKGLGQIAAATTTSRRPDQQRQAHLHLWRACQEYPLERSSRLALGQMLLARKRPRAALRQLQGLLEEMKDRDMTTSWRPLQALGWEARVTAARACLLCAERDRITKPNDDRSWTLEHIPDAITWVELAIQAAPNDGRLHGLLGRAKELLQEAEAKKIS